MWSKWPRSVENTFLMFLFDKKHGKLSISMYMRDKLLILKNGAVWPGMGSIWSKIVENIFFRVFNPKSRMIK